MIPRAACKALVRCLALIAIPVAPMLTPAAGNVPAGSAPPPLVAADGLAGRLQDPSLVVVDARPSLREYLKEHIPGAQQLSVENLRSAAGGVPGQIFPPEIVAAIAARLGIGLGSSVVVYGAESDPDDAFVGSALRLSGFDSISILDGGLARWRKLGLPLTAERSLRPEAKAAAGGARREGLASRQEVLDLVAKGGAVLLDVRPVEQYEAGRIPGAINRPWQRDLVAPGGENEGSLKPAEALREEYASLGLAPERPVVVYCNTGHMASEVFYTLRYVLGHKEVRLYDGSWTEWSIAPGAPKESGPAKREAKPR